MASLKIPDSARYGLEKIIKASNEAMEEFYGALETAEPTLLRRDLSTTLAKKLKLMAPEEVDGILRTVLGMYDAASTSNISKSEFVENVLQVLENSKPEFEKVLKDRHDLLEQRLLKLLSFENSLGVTSKALDIMTEHQRILCGARVLTDIRPVFSKTSDKPNAAIILHTLKITYHENDEHKDFYVVLDASDLRELKQILERAEQKAQSLQVLLKNSQVSNLG